MPVRPVEASGVAVPLKPIEQCVILYVEDDATMAFLFRTALEECGFSPQLFHVTDGEQATAFLSQEGRYNSCAPPRPCAARP